MLWPQRRPRQIEHAVPKNGTKAMPTTSMTKVHVMGRVVLPLTRWLVERTVSTERNGMIVNISMGRRQTHCSSSERPET